MRREVIQDYFASFSRQSEPAGELGKVQSAMKPVCFERVAFEATEQKKREAEELIQSEALNQEEARRYIKASLRREYATENGTALNATLPKMSTLNPQYKAKKKTVFQQISAFVEKFKGVGGDI